jgi:hypothetical protein
MFKPKTYIEVCHSMQNKAEVAINGVIGIVVAIAIEDGAGRCFTITMTDKMDGDAQKKVLLAE